MELFKRPEFSDRQWVTELLSHEGSLACEHSFASIYLWSGVYDKKIARVGGRLLVQLRGTPGLCHLCPMGSGPLAPAIETAQAASDAQGAPLTLICLTAEQKALLEQEFPGRFTFEEDRDGYDYLYSIDKLADLAGKKLHGKRNHISRFCDQFPDWLFEPITPAQVEECTAMEREWFRQEEEMGRVDESLLRERQAVCTALAHMDELGLVGGLIRAGGRVVAFSLASPITERCFDVHFEKAYADLQGSYAVINRELARYLRAAYPGIAYLNREDDMGLPGLRKAKLSYFPDILLEKYTARQAALH